MLRSSGNSDSDVLDGDDSRRDKEAGAVQLGRQHRMLGQMVEVDHSTVQHDVRGHGPPCVLLAEE
jgi:hypothetical protein